MAKMQLTEKAQASLDGLVERFKAGDIGPMVEIACINLPADAPARKWSWGNRTLAYGTTGELDCRGFRQWQDVGRWVKPQTHGGFILRPQVAKVKDADDGGQEVTKEFVVRYWSQAVHPYSNTDGEPIEEYTVTEPPPLADVAEKLGITVGYHAHVIPALGSTDPKGEKIRLYTKNARVWFHELAHTIDARIKGKLKPGQHEDQEVAAELAAAVLMHLYGLGDHTGNAWQYISSYADDPIKAIVKASDDVGKMLNFLFDLPENNGH